MGGAETWLVELVRYYRGFGSTDLVFDFVCTGGVKAIFDDELVASGSLVFYIPFKRNSVFSFAKQLRSVLRSNDYVAIHDHQDFFAGWHFLFAAGLLPPVRVVHLHVTYNQRVKSFRGSIFREFGFLLAKRLLWRSATHVLGTSGQILDGYGLSVNKIGVPKVGPFHCGVQLSKFAGDHSYNHASVCREFGWDEKVNIILFAGRFDRSLDVSDPLNHKNSAFALRVFSAVKDNNVRMIMAGENSYVLQEITQLASDLGVSERVVMVGVRSDIGRLMSASDVFILPSREEALGLVVVEAQASGLPVLASTSVSKETVVFDDLVVFNDLEQGVDIWAASILELLGKRRTGDTVEDKVWDISDYNIKVSYRNLKSLYFGGK